LTTGPAGPTQQGPAREGPGAAGGGQPRVGRSPPPAHPPTRTTAPPPAGRLGFPTLRPRSPPETETPPSSHAPDARQPLPNRRWPLELPGLSPSRWKRGEGTEPKRDPFPPGAKAARRREESEPPSSSAREMKSPKVAGDGTARGEPAGETPVSPLSPSETSEIAESPSSSSCRAQKRPPEKLAAGQAEAPPGQGNQPPLAKTNTSAPPPRPQPPPNRHQDRPSRKSPPVRTNRYPSISSMTFLSQTLVVFLWAAGFCDGQPGATELEYHEISLVLQAAAMHGAGKFSRSVPSTWSTKPTEQLNFKLCDAHQVI
jgi:hypothetical protein